MESREHALGFYNNVQDSQYEGTEEQSRCLTQFIQKPPCFFFEREN
jgi:hypothetical protein